MTTREEVWDKLVPTPAGYFWRIKKYTPGLDKLELRRYRTFWFSKTVGKILFSPEDLARITASGTPYFTLLAQGTLIKATRDIPDTTIRGKYLKYEPTATPTSTPTLIMDEAQKIGLTKKDVYTDELSARLMQELDNIENKEKENGR